MGESIKNLTETHFQKIVLKKGCWCEVKTGIQVLPNEIQAEAIPILFSNNELRGYKFKNHIYEGITYDLERITTVNNDEENHLHP